VKELRLRRLNAAKARGQTRRALAGSLVEQVARTGAAEKQHRRQLSRVHRRSSKKHGRQPARTTRRRAKSRNRVGQDRFRRRVPSENLSVSGSPRRRLLAQLITGKHGGGSTVRIFHQQVTPSRLVEDLRMKARGQREKNAGRSRSARPPPEHQPQQQRGGAACVSRSRSGNTGQPEGGKKKQPKENATARSQQ